MAGLQVYEREDGQFGWRFLGGNNEKQAVDGGQGFRDRTDAHRGFNDFVTALLATLVVRVPAVPEDETQEQT